MHDCTAYIMSLTQIEACRCQFITCCWGVSPPCPARAWRRPLWSGGTCMCVVVNDMLIMVVIVAIVVIVAMVVMVVIAYIYI